MKFNFKKFLCFICPFRVAQSKAKLPHKNAAKTSLIKNNIYWTNGLTKSQIKDAVKSA